MARYLTTYKMLALLVLIVPFWTSFLIRTYALKIILDPHGYLAQDLGINALYTMYAVGIGLVYNYLPLFILPVFASLERMDWTLVEAATDLGAKPFKAFRSITLRLTLPGVVTGALLVFIPMSRRVHHPEHPRRRELRVRRQRHRRHVRRGPELAVRLGALDLAHGGALGLRRRLHHVRDARGAVRCVGAGSSPRSAASPTWALLVYAFLYLPILVVVIFAFDKPSATSVAAFNGIEHLQHPAGQHRQHLGLERLHVVLVREGPERPLYILGDQDEPQHRRSRRPIIATVLGPRRPRSRWRACGGACESRSTSWST